MTEIELFYSPIVESTGEYSMKLFTVIIVFTLFSALGVVSHAEGPRADVDICHWDKDSGGWLPVTVNGHAVQKHFDKHDDSTRPGVTSNTGTTLNSACEEGLPSCGNCLTGHGGLGCDEAGCEALICGLDPFCCDVAWDDICAGEAIVECAGLVCSP